MGFVRFELIDGLEFRRAPSTSYSPESIVVSWLQAKQTVSWRTQTSVRQLPDREPAIGHQKLQEAKRCQEKQKDDKKCKKMTEGATTRVKNDSREVRTPDLSRNRKWVFVRRT